jgi:hypothetical protein
MKHNRHKANLELLKILTLAVNKYPDLRFGQILDFVGIVKVQFDDQGNSQYDEYYTESEAILSRVKESLGIKEKV